MCGWMAGDEAGDVQGDAGELAPLAGIAAGRALAAAGRRGGGRLTRLPSRIHSGSGALRRMAPWPQGCILQGGSEGSRLAASPPGAASVKRSSARAPAWCIRAMLALGAASAPVAASSRVAASRTGRQAAVAPAAVRPLRPAAAGFAALRQAASATGAAQQRAARAARRAPASPCHPTTNSAHCTQAAAPARARSRA